MKKVTDQVPSKMQAFDAVCAALLIHLYENFPVRISVEFTDLPLESHLEPLAPEEIWDWHEVFQETVSWLQNEGFIEVEDGTKDGDFVGVRLTMQGLAVLRAVPQSLQAPEPSLIEKLKGALGEGGKIASGETLRLAMGQLFMAASQGIGP